jgi:hypothetical protein
MSNLELLMDRDFALFIGCFVFAWVFLWCLFGAPKESPSEKESANDVIKQCIEEAKKQNANSKEILRMLREMRPR